MHKQNQPMEIFSLSQCIVNLIEQFEKQNLICQNDGIVSLFFVFYGVLL